MRRKAPGRLPQSDVDGVRAQRNADGSIVWKIRYIKPDGTDGYKTADTREAAEQFKLHADELRRQLRGRGGHYSPTDTFESVALRTVEASQSRQSRESMVNRLRRILPTLGHLPVGMITPSDVQACVNTWAGLAASTQSGLLGTISTVFETAVMDGQRLDNPVHLIKKRNKRQGGTSKIITREMVWPDAWVTAVAHHIREDYGPFPYLAAGCGLRQGEAFAVSPDDFDFDAGTLTVNRQIGLLGGNRPYFGPPKHRKASDPPRVVPLPAKTGEIIAAFLEEFPTEKVTLPWNPGYEARLVPYEEWELRTVELIMVSREGKATNRNYWNGAVWKPALAAAGIPHGAGENGTHNLRHYFACRALDAGVKITDLSSWLGHNDPAFTLRVYGRLQDGLEVQRSPMTTGLFA